MLLFNNSILHAEVAKLADALALGASGRNSMGVQVSPCPQLFGINYSTSSLASFLLKISVLFIVNVNAPIPIS